MLAPTVSGARPSDKTSNELGTIVVVHGFGSKRFLMALLCRRLRRAGYRVHNWGYFSLFGNISKHARRLSEFLQSLDGEGPLHVVAHSMGSIVVRCALANAVPANLGRLVFIAPPNRGSPLARIAERILAPICAPIGELSTREDSFVNSLPDAHSYELGILAAKYDLLIPANYSHLAGERDYKVLSGSHSSLLLSRTVVEEVESFLKHGRFSAM
jgi:pimeloyl-ACP methyl ester carboxylesterase